MSRSDKHTQIFIKAEKLIKRPKHWGKFKLYDEKTKKYCTLGALRQASYEVVPRDYIGTYYWECAEMFARANRIKTPLAQWNDSPKTTHTIVLKAFHNAISAAI